MVRGFELCATLHPAVRRSTIASIALLAATGLAAAVPIAPATVERVYSTGVYPALQHVLTTFSNRAPFALIDVLLALAAVWLVVLAVALRRLFRRGAPGRGQRLAAGLLLPPAVLYLAFLALWGLNYRRIPLEDKLKFDAAAVTPDAARSLADVAVSRINVLYDAAHAAGWADVDASLADAFASAARKAGVATPAVPGRPRRTLLDWYFRSAAVAGMTDPFFLETLVASDLLPFERPFVIAHEWSHLAGFADEGEANFVGWLACLDGAAPVQYSGWMSLYAEIVGGLSRSARAEVAARLEPGPRKDLRALADRLTRNVNPTVSAAGWRVYDRYLKANRVEGGSASYARVVRLALGTELGQRAMAR
jgi:predicted small integral membrane protein